MHAHKYQATVTFEDITSSYIYFLVTYFNSKYKHYLFKSNPKPSPLKNSLFLN